MPPAGIDRKASLADRGLTWRMSVSYLLLGLVYVLFMWILLQAGVGYLPMVVILGAMLAVQYFFSDRMVLAATGAKLVKEGEEPELSGMVAKLAQLADLPTPRLAVIDTAVPNAFATGRDPHHAVVAVTRGLTDRLTPEEVEAVLAHEMTHIKNRDVRLMTLASFFATLASYITQMSLWFGFGFGYGGGRRQQQDQMLILLASMLVWVISFFLIRAISRYREYAADRGSAVLTGQPSQLASALVKISGVMQRVPQKDLRTAESLSALYIFPMVRSGSLIELFQTHPSLEHRLAHLQRLEEEMAR